MKWGNVIFGSSLFGSESKFKHFDSNLQKQKVSILLNI